jgi:predicted Fe-S protein YdhL (DUF1289 family)
MAERAPTSPCTNVCTLDSAGCCQGCYRHIDEIVRWGQMSAREQWAVLALLDKRRRERESAPV